MSMQTWLTLVAWAGIFYGIFKYVSLKEKVRMNPEEYYDPVDESESGRSKSFFDVI